MSTHLHVVLVNEYLDDRRSIRNALSAIVPVHVRSFSSGRAALKSMIRSYPPDLALIGRHLPDLDGVQLAHRMKKRSRLSNVPIVMVCESLTDRALKEALDEGVRAFLLKPVTPQKLRREMDRIISLNPVSECQADANARRSP